MNIICNGRQLDAMPYKRLTYDEVVTLAFGPQVVEASVFTVTYSHRKGNKFEAGSLSKTESVKLKDGMVFNCTRTNAA